MQLLWPKIINNFRPHYRKERCLWNQYFTNEFRITIHTLIHLLGISWKWDIGNNFTYALVTRLKEFVSIISPFVWLPCNMPSSFGIRPTGPLGLFQRQKSKNPRSSTDTNIDPFGLLVFIKKMISRGETTLLVRDKTVINVWYYLPVFTKRRALSGTNMYHLWRWRGHCVHIWWSWVIVREAACPPSAFSIQGEMVHCGLKLNIKAARSLFFLQNILVLVCTVSGLSASGQNKGQSACINNNTLTNHWPIDSYYYRQHEEDVNNPYCYQIVFTVDMSTNWVADKLGGALRRHE